MRSFKGLVVVVGLAACGASPGSYFPGGGGGGGGGNELPPVVTIEVTGATIAPFIPSDGTFWDGTGSVGQGDINALGLAAGNYSEVLKLIAQIGNSAYSAPDPFGSAEVFIDGAWGYYQSIGVTMDTYQPSFSGIGITGAPLKQGMKMRVSLTDEDTFNDDPIGKAELSYADLKRALDDGHIIQVDVSQQTGGSIQFLGVSVSPE